MHQGEHDPMAKTEKLVLTEAEANRFASGASYEIKEGKIHACCVDGREEGAEAELSVPGADAGYFLIALAAAHELGIELSDELRARILDTVVEMVGGPGEFRFHTDSHARHGAKPDVPAEETVARGCGHLKLAEKDPGSYGLVSEDMSAVFGKLAELARQGTQEVVLDGEHGERAVFVVNDSTHGLRHQIDGKQAFVFHAGLNLATLRELAQRLAVIPELASASSLHGGLDGALQGASDRQRTLTVNTLASGRPIYSVGFNESGEADVVLLGNVP